MAAAPQTVSPPALLTYEAYMAEGEVRLRYDIIDGERIVTNPTRFHQDILANLLVMFRIYQQQARTGRVFLAPCDVLIRRAPLRTRQPDLLFISNVRVAQNPPITDPAPLSPAPELVVEILSPSDTRRVLTGKLADYQSVGVQECWVVSPGQETVEVLELTPDAVNSAATYSAGEQAQSVVFPGLAVPVRDVFAV